MGFDSGRAAVRAPLFYRHSKAREVNGAGKTIFITGITGFVGQALTRQFRKDGFTVVGSSSRKFDPASLLVRIRLAHAKADLASIDFSGMWAVVHGAYDAQKGQMPSNIEGTLAIAEAARKAGVVRQLFVSSYSANPDVETDYAVAKKRLEKYFRENQHLVVRPGLVVGSGGLFERMTNLMRKFPVVPLLAGGKGQVATVVSQDLALAVSNLLGSQTEGEFNLFSPQRPRLLDLLRMLREAGSFKTAFLPIPAVVLLVPLKFIEMLRIPFPISSQNIRGYLANSGVEMESHLATALLPETETPLKSAIGLLFQNLKDV